MIAPRPLSAQEIPFETMTTLTREMLAEYARVSRDHNEIHLRDEVAKKAGLPGVIAHGMLIAGLIVERAQRFLDGYPDWRIAATQFRFKAMSFPGDVIVVGGKCVPVSDSEFKLELVAQRATAETTTVASIKVSRLTD
ncbi:MAG: MaoC family dehydratase [Bacteriovoracia bacterium]